MLPDAAVIAHVRDWLTLEPFSVDACSRTFQFVDSMATKWAMDVLNELLNFFPLNFVLSKVHQFTVIQVNSAPKSNVLDANFNRGINVGIFNLNPLQSSYICVTIYVEQIKN